MPTNKPTSIVKVEENSKLPKRDSSNTKNKSNNFKNILTMSKQKEMELNPQECKSNTTIFSLIMNTSMNSLLVKSNIPKNSSQISMRLQLNLKINLLKKMI
jgi:hypothetical protein